MMIWTLLAAALAAAPADFEAQTLDGRSVVGRLEKLDSKELTLATDAGPQTLALAALASARPHVAAAQPEATARASVWVELVDDSLLAAESYTVGHGQAKILVGGEALEAPARSIRWVRFSNPAAADEKLAGQWADVLAAKPLGDLLVVRKNDSLDYLEGVVGDLDETTCKFELDKEPRSVKRTKIEGIVYFHARPAELGEPLGIAETRGGTRLALGSVALADGRLQATTTAGLKLSLPLDEVARFDFSAGKIAFLSDLTPESFKYVPYFGFKDQPAAVSEFYAFRRDSGFDQQPLKLDGKTYAKGLALASRSTLVYRLPGKFRLLKTVIGIDDSAGEGGDVHVEFHGDGGKMLWQGDVRAADAPRELEIDVAGVKRLEIVVDYGGDLDIGDWLDLAEARVTK